MGLLFYLSYGAVVVAFAFVTLSLASGLLYVSELIEEHSRLAKSIGQRGIYAIIVLHGVLYLSDSLPLSHIAFSAACHIVYLQNFSHTWPLISLASPSFIGSCILVIADHFLWFFHFARISQDARHSRSFRGAPPQKGVPGFAEIATFFGICVWAAPLFLFLSLSANDNALPVTTGAVAEGTPGDALKYTQNRVSLFRSILPMRPRSTRTLTSEGLLAPHAPAPIPPRSPLLQPLPSPRYSTMTPPRSPRARPAELDAPLAAGSFKLNTPPRRSTQGATGDSTLGQRRSILPEGNVFGAE
ncbi:transmembrane adaptor Erv26-domain-containing protein [Mycena maculata]|uniref:Transmembrane adaptor Erv26-domain-containing protein n=1 Tax=Mycena maculata TaxID=230809 RepID=A0AAD7IXP3_9AGAR|nr:transmembrane adaptor Erv26-domain-containing protein [Mycena maculata]